MNIFTIGAAIAMVVIAAVTLVAFVCVLVFGRKKTRTFRAVLLGVCCLPVVTAIGLFDRMFGPLDISEPAELREAYRFEFGEEPSADVTVIHGRQVVVGDSGAAWLTFQASPETVERLLKKFIPSDSASFSTSSEGANCPSWWHPEAASLVKYYKAEHWSAHFSHSEALMAHNGEKRTVFFFHSGFD